MTRMIISMNNHIIINNTVISQVKNMHGNLYNETSDENVEAKNFFPQTDQFFFW